MTRSMTDTFDDDLARMADDGCPNCDGLGDLYRPVALAV